MPNWRYVFQFLFFNLKFCFSLFELDIYFTYINL